MTTPTQPYSDALTDLAGLEGTLAMSFLSVGGQQPADWTQPVVVIEVAHDRVDPVRLHAWLEVDIRAELVAAGHGTCALATDDLNCQLWVTGGRLAEAISLVFEAASQIREVRWIGALTAESVQVDLGLIPAAGLTARDAVFAGAAHQNTGFRTQWLATLTERCCLPWLEDHLQSTCEGVRSGDYWECVADGVRTGWFGPDVPHPGVRELYSMVAMG